MKDKIDQKIEQDGNIWIYLIISIIIILFVTNKCSIKNIEYEKQYDEIIKTRTAVHCRQKII